MCALWSSAIWLNSSFRYKPSIQRTADLYWVSLCPQLFHHHLINLLLWVLANPNKHFESLFSLCWANCDRERIDFSVRPQKICVHEACQGDQSLVFVIE